MMRRLLAALAILSLAFAVTARAQVDTKPGKTKAPKDAPELRGDSKVLVTDSLARQQALKRAFESFRQRLAILANRLEGGTDADKEKAKQLKKALSVANELGTEAKFDSMIRALSG